MGGKILFYMAWIPQNPNSSAKDPTLLDPLEEAYEIIKESRPFKNQELEPITEEYGADSQYPPLQ